MKLSPFAFLASAAALIAVATLGTAQIERLDLAQMVAKTDNAVIGKIVARHVVRIDHPVDGPELYFTTVTIEGKSLQNDKPVTVDVSHMGGWIDETHGSFNSEAPSADDTKIGNMVVCFYKHVENMGGDFAGNVIYTWHGGIYRTFERKGISIVQGRGDGYAIATNVALTDLKSEITTLAQQKGGGR
jgi:hypothetical protein